LTPPTDRSTEPNPRAARLLLALCAISSLLPDLGAALPLKTYYFRDFSVTFYPLRAFAARELAAGRWPFWNPFIYEGSFVLPMFYPLDLLHALLPGPVAASWLLTLHFPLAAVAAFVLARELGADSVGAFASGAVYALGGLALSSLNLYLFLQALAWAPLVVLTLRRAALRGGRSLVWAGGILAVALSTLALEFVGQVVLLGLALGLAAAPVRAASGRVGLSILLGVGLAGVPLAVTAGLLSESVRGTGFTADVALANAVPVVSLLQVLVPNLFGSLASPVEAWWGGAFFSKGLPYFLSLYLGPLALALAWAGLPAAEPRSRGALVGLAALALWYSLGAAGGLTPIVQKLPFFSSLRFPSKALLLPHLAVALFAGLGATSLRQGRGWSRFVAASAAAGAIALAVATVVKAGGVGLARWSGVDPSRFGQVAGAVVPDALRVVAVASVALALAVVVVYKRAPAGMATALLLALLVYDLTRAGGGLNPQTTPSFFRPLPEMAALRPDEQSRTRVFSYGLDHSPAFRAFLARGGASLGLASFYVNRQMLAPYNNVLDRVEATEATDLTSFVPRPRELGPSDYDPASAGALLPWIRNASVSRVLSLDPLDHPDFVALPSVEVLPGATIHGYAVRDSWPRAFLACRVVPATSVDDALGRPYAAGFDPARDVTLEEPAAASCSEGTATLAAYAPGDESYVVRSDGDGLFVLRESFARGWRATVDGKDARTLRANGKHRAVPVFAGTHEVRLRYHPPGLRAGLALTALAAAGVAILLRHGKGEDGRA
jgi:Bacterial membrane protein YfhO